CFGAASADSAILWQPLAPPSRVARAPQQNRIVGFGRNRMKKWLILLWLLIPVALLSYHFGPGQDALAFRQAQEHLLKAQEFEQAGHYEEAIEAYAESQAALPV